MRGGSAAAATDGAAPSLGARVQAHDSRSNAARPEREEGEKKYLKNINHCFGSVEKILKNINQCFESVDQDFYRIVTFKQLVNFLK
jgi:hypothetical protein